MNDRILSVDVVRLFAAFFVVIIHTQPMLSLATCNVPDDCQTGVLLNQIARFAVPFFFIISGYFFWGKILTTGNPHIVSKKMLVRIITILLFWNLIYLLPYNILTVFSGPIMPLKEAYWHLSYLLENPVNLLFQGTREHLWFLFSLIYSIAVSYLFVRLGLIKLLMVLSVILYVVGVLGGSYSHTMFGFSLDFNTRNGVFFSLIFFSIGFMFAKATPSSNWFWYGLATFLIGYVLVMWEVTFLNSFTLPEIELPDYVFTTVLMGIGSAMMALSDHKLLSNAYMAPLGKYALGIYLIHMIFIDNLKPYNNQYSSEFADVIYSGSVFILSIIFTYLFSGTKRFKRFFI